MPDATASAEISLPDPFMDEAPAEEAAGVPGWFRIDTDGFGTQLWVGATHDLGGLDFATDIYVVGAFARLDLGIVVEFGPVAMLPLVGIGFDFAKQVTVGLVPQLFTIIASDALYFESWVQFFLNSVIHEQTGNSVYTRDFLLYNVSDGFAIGPQFELTAALDDFAKRPDSDKAITSTQLGGRINVAYGENNTLGLYLGAELVGEAQNEDKIVGRFTFVRSW